MKKIRFRLGFNKKKVIDKNVAEEIKIIAEQSLKAITIHTNVFVLPQQWDEDSSEIINHPNGEALNRLLQEELIRLEWMELQCWKKGKPISLNDLTVIYTSERNEFVTFSEFCKEYISVCDKKESTKLNLMTTVKLIDIFRPEINIEDIDYDFLIGFEHFLLNKRYKINTVTKHIKHIKSFYNEAVVREMVTTSNEGVRRYKTKHANFKYSFLLPDELEKLECIRLDSINSKLQHTLDAFLFCCYTGLRYSDFRSLSMESLVLIEKNEWIIYKSVKTDTETKLPLHLLFNGKAKFILDKYRDNLNSFFGIKSNSAVDKDLIKIRQISGIKTHLSFHTARHTNATLLIYKGINITTVQKLLGHRSIKTTQHYIDVLPEGIVNDLKKGFA